MQTPEFNFVVIYVSNMDASYNYFVNVLGFEPVSEADSTSANFRQLKGKGGIDFGLIVPDETDQGKAGNIEIYVKTDDIQALHQAISSKGVNSGPIMDRPFGQIFPVPAPDGVRVVVLGDPA